MMARITDESKIPALQLQDIFLSSLTVSPVFCDFGCRNSYLVICPGKSRTDVFAASSKGKSKSMMPFNLRTLGKIQIFMS